MSTLLIVFFIHPSAVWFIEVTSLNDSDQLYNIQSELIDQLTNACCIEGLMTRGERDHTLCYWLDLSACHIIAVVYHPDQKENKPSANTREI